MAETAMTDLRERFESVRTACIAAALQAWEDAGIQGLCAEGRWEAAISAIRSLDLTAIIDSQTEGLAEEPAQSTSPAIKK
jgi:hypothetical protein